VTSALQSGGHPKGVGLDGIRGDSYPGPCQPSKKAKEGLPYVRCLGVRDA
jgi:hypothetical protein